MKYENYCWIDVAFGGAHNRNNLVDVRRVRLPEKPVDCYRTVYRYPDAMREHFEQHRSVSGYRGYVYADWVPIDIDAEDLAEAYRMAREALNQLAARYDVNLEQLHLFFSGAKGFHILLPAEMFDLKPEKLMPQALKRMMAGMFDGVVIDPVIYDVVRLFRFSNSINSKTGLYKIPLTAAELLHSPLEQVLEWAKKPRKVELPEPAVLNAALAELYEKALGQVAAPGPAPVGDVNRKRDKFTKACITRLLGGVGQGERNEAALRLASHYLKQGMSSDMVLALLGQWNLRNQPPIDGRELEGVCASAVEHQYDYGCGDVILGRYCDPSCHFFKGAEKRNSKLDDIKDVAEAYEAYLEYIRNLRKARIKLGFGVLDDAMRGIAPGEVCQILARSGVGKTTLVLNILKNVSESGAGPSLFFTLEMPLAQMFERMCQIAAGMTGQQVELAAHDMAEGLETYDSARGLEMASRVFGAYGGVYFVDRDGLSLDAIQEYATLAESRIGNKPRLLAIDYMGRMDGGYGTVYEQASRLAKGLKRIAKDLDVAVLSLHQVSREGGDGSTPITLEMGRDSGVIEEAADTIIGCWRPEKHAKVLQAEEPIIVALLKNRRGAETQTELVFHKPTLRISTKGA